MASAGIMELSAEQLIARGIAPIKKQYRLPAIRFTQQGAAAAAAAAAAPAAAADGTGGSVPVAAAAADGAGPDDALEAAGAEARAAAGADGATAPRGKSKKQLKRVRCGGRTVCWRLSTQATTLHRHTPHVWRPATHHATHHRSVQPPSSCATRS
jgi:hypothetical protein